MNWIRVLQNVGMFDFTTPYPKNYYTKSVQPCFLTESNKSPTEGREALSDGLGTYLCQLERTFGTGTE